MALIKPPQALPNRAAVHVAATAISSTSVGSPPKMLSDHDPMLPMLGPIALTARVLDTPRLASLQNEIIFIFTFNQCSTGLPCSAHKSQKSVVYDDATPFSAGV